MAQTVKNLPATLETSVRSLGSEDPLEEGVATHSSTLAMDRGSLAGYRPWGLRVSDTTDRLTHVITLQSCVNLLYKEMNQQYVYIYPLPLIFFRTQ